LAPSARWARTWKARIAELRSDTCALYLACRDPRVPWYAKGLVILIAACALSPIDLIPDFVPVLGYLDDLVLVPLGIAFAVRLIPPEVLAEHRRHASRILASQRPRIRLGAAIVVVIWHAAALAAF
jgi:uncharacterized membrane protein YkvA (DUF1232 family)